MNVSAPTGEAAIDAASGARIAGDHRPAGLLGPDSERGIAHVGPSEPYRLAPPEAGVEQQIEREALMAPTTANGPTIREAGQFSLSPGVKPGVVVPAAERRDSYGRAY